MKKYIIGILIGIVLSSGVVLAGNIFASNIPYDNSRSHLKDSNNQDVTTVQGAIDALYIKADNDYIGKTYTQEGLTVYDNRVTILEGGYYTDTNNITWVSLKLRVNKNLNGNTDWLLLYGFPTSNKTLTFVDNNKQYAFKFNSSNMSIQDSINYMDYSSTTLSQNEEVLIQFKY